MIRGILIVWLLGACAAPLGPTGGDSPSVQPETEVRPSVLPEALQGRPTSIVVASVQVNIHLSESSLIDAVPEGAAFVMEGTSWPCDSGTTFVYSHAREGMFLSLWDVRVGDVVSFVSASGPVCDYVVRGTRRVSSSDTSWFTYNYPGAERTAILQTSTGPSVAYPEFIVICEGR